MIPPSFLKSETVVPSFCTVVTVYSAFASSVKFVPASRIPPLDNVTVVAVDSCAPVKSSFFANRHVAPLSTFICKVDCLSAWIKPVNNALSAIVAVNSEVARSVSVVASAFSDFARIAQPFFAAVASDFSPERVNWAFLTFIAPVWK